MPTPHSAWLEIVRIRCTTRKTFAYFYSASRINNRSMSLRQTAKALFTNENTYIAGWSSLVARRAHNPEVVGSNPAPATKLKLQVRVCFFSDLLFVPLV